MDWVTALLTTWKCKIQIVGSKDDDVACWIQPNILIGLWLTKPIQLKAYVCQHYQAYAVRDKDQRCIYNDLA